MGEEGGRQGVPRGRWKCKRGRSVSVESLCSGLGLLTSKWMPCQCLATLSLVSHMKIGDNNIFFLSLNG